MWRSRRAPRVPPPYSPAGGSGAQRRHEQVHVDAGQPLGRLAAHHVGDDGAQVAPLGHVAGIAEPAHQLRPGPGGAADVPADLRRLGGEAVSGQGRQHQVERILGRSAGYDRVGQWPDRPEHLHHRTRPAVRHDQWERAGVRRPNVDEVDVQAVHPGRELRQRVQPGLAPAPVVVRLPVAGELPDRGQLDALGPVVDQLPAGQACRCDAPAQLGQLLGPDLVPEGIDLAGRRVCGG